MKILFLWAILVVFGVFYATSDRAVRETEKYTTKYDNFDVDAVLSSKRLVYSYVKCLLEKGPCSPEGRLLRSYIPDALLTGCSKCSDVQKKQSGRVFSHLLLNYRNEWDLLVAKYDKDGIFRKQYEIDDNNNDDYSDLDEAK